MNLLGITKIGEGFQNPEGFVPIDIHCNKLLDWLISRKKVSQKWKSQRKLVQEKINVALSDLPNNVEELQIWKQIESLTFFDCVEIVNILGEKAGEIMEKNLFGQYLSKRMGLWQEILRVFQQDNFHLADASNVLISIESYEIPSLRKTIDQCGKQIHELNKKEQEWNRTKQMFSNRFAQACSESGIEGKDVRSELISLSSQLPLIFQQVIDLVQTDPIRQACEFYWAFIERIQCRENSLKIESRNLPTLHKVLYHGNIAIGTFQIKSTENEKKSSLDSSSKSLEIDWSVLDEPNSTEKSSIKEAIQDQPLTIDWDMPMNENESFSHQYQSAPMEPKIVWEECISNEGETNNNMIGNESVDIEVVEAASFGGLGISVAKATPLESSSVEKEGINKNPITPIKPSQMTIDVQATNTEETKESKEFLLENTDCRNRFLNDLFELQCFLLQRQNELKDSNDSTMVIDSSSKLSSEDALRSPSEEENDSLGNIPNQTMEFVRKCLTSIEEIIQLMEAPKLRRIIEVKNSKRYTDRLVATFQHYLECIQKSQDSIIHAARKREELNATITESALKLEKLSGRAKLLKTEIEKALSKQYSGRIIHIIDDT